MEQCVLLGLVEPMNLIDEQHRLATQIQVGPALTEDFTHTLHAGGNGGYFEKSKSGGTRQDFGQGRFT